MQQAQPGLSEAKPGSPAISANLSFGCDGDYRLLYYRDADKFEVDVVIENTAGQCIGVEVKATASLKESDLRGLKKLAAIAGDQFKMGIVLYDGDAALPLGGGIWAAPLSSLWERKQRHRIRLIAATGMAAGARFGEVEHHCFHAIHAGAAVTSQVGPMRLAVARLEHAHRRLVGMQDELCQLCCRSTSTSGCRCTLHTPTH